MASKVKFYSNSMLHFRDYNRVFAKMHMIKNELFGGLLKLQISANILQLYNMAE